ncbi:MAG: hypothetical protein ACK4FG_02070 [Brevundimonas sp.]
MQAEAGVDQDHQGILLGRLRPPISSRAIAYVSGVVPLAALVFWVVELVDEVVGDFLRVFSGEAEDAVERLERSSVGKLDGLVVRGSGDVDGHANERVDVNAVLFGW